MTEKYRQAARNFIHKHAESEGNPEKIICPYRRCRNLIWHSPRDVVTHLVCFGIDPTYDVWIFHGEARHSRNEADEVADTYRMYFDAQIEDEENEYRVNDKHREGTKKLLETAEIPLYPGCISHTKLSAMILLYKHKARNGITDTAFTELLMLIKDMLPKENKLPNSTYTTKKLIKSFGLGYRNIHACANDCCLFRKELAHCDFCPKCGKSRWKKNKTREDGKQSKIPMKVLRYFPLIPRLKRMFMSPETSEQLRWHSSNKREDCKLQHPVDSSQWSTIDRMYPSFASDPRNLRLGLASDGFNPFGDWNSTYSCWPVFLVAYNFPLWLCMHKDNMMLSLLIPGLRQPGNDIDVYLQPLIEVLNKLWNKGVKVYDAFNRSEFRLNAILMWTINDFPAYGNLAGCTVKGKRACPVCGINTCSIWLPFSKKCAYLGHRRFLAPNHEYRHRKNLFDGTIENRQVHPIHTGAQIFEDVKDIVNEWGKKTKEEEIGGRKRKRGDVKKKGIQMWKKKSIFFDLPYWKTLPLRHNLDVMHVEKNICESILGTLLDIKGKTKDGITSGQDLEAMRIRKMLCDIPGFRGI